MDDILDDLVRAALRCERASHTFEDQAVQDRVSKLQHAINEIAKAWSGSWFGYHARVYIRDFRPRAPGEAWSLDWGNIQSFSHATVGDWQEHASDTVAKAIEARAGLPADKLQPLQDAAEHARLEFEEVKDDILPTLDAVLAVNEDARMREVRAEIAALSSHFAAADFISVQQPRGEFISRDMRAMSEGVKVPPHIQIQAQLIQELSYGNQISELGKKIRYLQRYLQKRLKMSGRTVSKTTGKIFIGHGRAPAWRDLKDFIQDRLGLPWDEFNREATAGLSTKERLAQMLDDATFALLVMTAEDEKADGAKTARANVIHEVGLFQGRLGFERAIVLLEEGCEEFSNIVGLSQIRFPKQSIKTAFEDIRHVLEREHILPKAT